MDAPRGRARQFEVLNGRDAAWSRPCTGWVVARRVRNEMMMTRRRRFPIVGGLLILALLASSAEAQQTSPAEAETAPAVTVPITPGDLARIRRALDVEPAVR